MANGRKDCPRCKVRPLDAGRCDECRERNRRNMVASRVRRGVTPMGRCWRCQIVHPMPRYSSERFCPLAAEYEGDFWKGPKEESA